MYKLYDKAWTYKQTINKLDIKSDISFSSNENWGQGQLRLRLNYSFDSSTISATDIIKIYDKDVLIYTWIVWKVTRKITNSYDEITVPILWLNILTSFILFKDTWNYIFSKNQEPATTIKEIIDYINSIYTAGWLSYTWSTIIDYWTSINIDFENDTCQNALIKCIEATDQKLFIDKSWVVYFNSKPVTPTHQLTVWKDIEEIIVDEDSENIVNTLILERKSWITPYTDPTSIATYWLREKYISKTDLVDIWSANEFWANYIAENKNPVIKTKIVVNKNYDLKTLKVLDTIKVNNFKYLINNLQIVKLNYTTDKVILELETFDSFWKEIFDN